MILRKASSSRVELASTSEDVRLSTSAGLRMGGGEGFDGRGQAHQQKRRLGGTHEPRPRGGILVIGPVPPPYHGASVVQAAVVEWLRLQGEQTMVVDTSGSGRSGLMFHAYRARQHVVAAMKLLGKGSRRLAVYITGAGGAGLWYQLAIILVAHAHRRRIVFHHHSYAYLNKKRTVMTLIVRVGGKSTTHVALSTSMADALRAVYPDAQTVEVCSNAAIIGPRHEVPLSDADELRIGHLSNLSSQKGLDRVLRCHAAAVDAGYQVHLHLAGPPADIVATASLKAALAGPYSKYITYYGNLERHQIADFFSVVDVFLFPSQYVNEAEPLVVLEALQARVPVLASQVGCLTEALRLSPWPAIQVSSFEKAFMEALGDISTIYTAAKWRGYLQGVADSQIKGFVPTSLNVILKGVRV